MLPNIGSPVAVGPISGPAGPAPPAPSAAVTTPTAHTTIRHTSSASGGGGGGSWRGRLLGRRGGGCSH